MGQKVNPVGLRIGIYRGWNSRWFANKKDFAKFLNEDLKIRRYLDANLKDAQLSHVEIERVKTDKGTKVSVLVFVGRPGVVYGQDGVRIEKIKKDLEKVVKSGILTIEVNEVKNPNLNAKLVAMSIAKQLEERASFRIAQKRTIQAVRKAGAKGVKTLVSGRLGGAEIARSEGYREGTIPLHTLRSDIDYAQVEAHTTYGRLGVKVWICRGDYRPEVDEKPGQGE
ncbi:MAG TPA: 30S ribosomal protein S3 [Firmicutes bacterium]|jgi:small subunit ribosomal protein S3|nr:30S ribosomal protein S3 [Bacillota bacterium]HAV19995.1 30S ribosomal protein S3 [Bacillota bacterium]